MSIRTAHNNTDDQLPDAEAAPMEEEIHLLTSSDICVAGEVEVGSISDENVIPYIPDTLNRTSINIGIENDHNYCANVENIIQCMERLVIVEEENRELKKKLRMKQKQTWALKANIRALQEESKKLKSDLLLRSSNLADPMLMELQKNKNRKTRGARFSDKMRNMSIILHYCSSKAYRQMRKIFTLPSVETIKRWLSRLNIKEGFSSTILQLLKFKVAGLPEDEKLVTVFIDEMSVSQRLTYVANSDPDYFMGFPTKVGKETVNMNQRASAALTIMVKSIKSGFKQAIGYFFNTSSLKSERLQNIVNEGLKLEAQCPKLPSQSRKPYFIDGWLIYISAIEGLWKDLQNNHGFSFLRTRNLSQDCLEHFFSLIRWKNCNNNHPDPSKFSSAYKSISWTVSDEIDVVEIHKKYQRAEVATLRNTRSGRERRRSAVIDCNFQLTIRYIGCEPSKETAVYTEPSLSSLTIVI
ncbi:uncharacterized protein LOC135704508 [Ochlerotatus camptorhynchus]|uniref:uncharacterized protein LOC135704508 n=1 Tax=Ochlerotatus camptorhynchus TaxID=644619 RepID=UPI0031D2E8CC